MDSAFELTVSRGLQRVGTAGRRRPRQTVVDNEVRMVDELLDTPVYQVIWGLVVRRAQGVMTIVVSWDVEIKFV